MKTMRTCLAITAMALMMMLPAPRAAAQDYTDLAKAYDIKGYPGEGDFQNIYGMAVDETDNTLTVLAGPPLGLYTFNLYTGAGVGRIPIQQDIKPPLVMWRCDQPTVILSSLGFTAFGDDGQPVRDYKRPANLPKSLSQVLCTQQQNLIFFDDVNLRITGMDINQKVLFDITTDKAKKRKSDADLYSITDVATDALGELYVLDGKAGAVKRFSHRGDFRRVVVRTSGLSESIHLSWPKLLAVDAMGNIWLYDEGDLSIKAYDDFGFLKYQVPNAGPSGFLFQSPEWMAIDRTNHLMLYDKGTRSIHVFDLNQLH